MRQRNLPYFLLRNFVLVHVIFNQFLQLSHSWQVIQHCPYGHYFNNGCVECWCNFNTGLNTCQRKPDCPRTNVNCPNGEKYKDDCNNECTCYENTGAVFCQSHAKCDWHNKYLRDKGTESGPPRPALNVGSNTASKSSLHSHGVEIPKPLFFSLRDDDPFERPRKPQIIDPFDFDKEIRLATPKPLVFTDYDPPMPSRPPNEFNLIRTPKPLVLNEQPAFIRATVKPLRTSLRENYSYKNNLIHQNPEIDSESSGSIAHSTVRPTHRPLPFSLSEFKYIRDSFLPKPSSTKGSEPLLLTSPKLKKPALFNYKEALAKLRFPLRTSVSSTTIQPFVSTTTEYPRFEKVTGIPISSTRRPASYSESESDSLEDFEPHSHNPLLPYPTLNLQDILGPELPLKDADTKAHYYFSNFEDSSSAPTIVDLRGKPMLKMKGPSPTSLYDSNSISSSTLKENIFDFIDNYSRGTMRPSVQTRNKYKVSTRPSVFHESTSSKSIYSGPKEIQRPLGVVFRSQPHKSTKRPISFVKSTTVGPIFASSTTQRPYYSSTLRSKLPFNSQESEEDIRPPVREPIPFDPLYPTLESFTTGISSTAAPSRNPEPMEQIPATMESVSHFETMETSDNDDKSPVVLRPHVHSWELAPYGNTVSSTPNSLDDENYDNENREQGIYTGSSSTSRPHLYMEGSEQQFISSTSRPYKNNPPLEYSTPAPDDDMSLVSFHGFSSTPDTLQNVDDNFPNYGSQNEAQVPPKRYYGSSTTLQPIPPYIDYQDTTKSKPTRRPYFGVQQVSSGDKGRIPVRLPVTRRPVVHKHPHHSPPAASPPRFYNHRPKPVVIHSSSNIVKSVTKQKAWNQPNPNAVKLHTRDPFYFYTYKDKHANRKPPLIGPFPSLPVGPSNMFEFPFSKNNKPAGLIVGPVHIPAPDPVHTHRPPNEYGPLHYPKPFPSMIPMSESDHYMHPKPKYPPIKYYDPPVVSSTRAPARDPYTERDFENVVSSSPNYIFSKGVTARPSYNYNDKPTHTRTDIYHFEQVPSREINGEDDDDRREQQQSYSSPIPSSSTPRPSFYMTTFSPSTTQKPWRESIRISSTARPDPDPIEDSEPSSSHHSENNNENTGITKIDNSIKFPQVMHIHYHLANKTIDLAYPNENGDGEMQHEMIQVSPSPLTYEEANRKPITQLFSDGYPHAHHFVPVTTDESIVTSHLYGSEATQDNVPAGDNSFEYSSMTTESTLPTTLEEEIPSPPHSEPEDATPTPLTFHYKSAHPSVQSPTRFLIEIVPADHLISDKSSESDVSKAATNGSSTVSDFANRISVAAVEDLLNGNNEVLEVEEWNKNKKADAYVDTDDIADIFSFYKEMQNKAKVKEDGNGDNEGNYDTQTHGEVNRMGEAAPETEAEVEPELLRVVPTGDGINSPGNDDIVVNMGDKFKWKLELVFDD